MALELKVLENTQGSLVINYEEFKVELQNAIEGYKDLVIVEKIDEKIYTPNGVNQNGINLYIDVRDGNEYKVVTFTEAKSVRAKLNSAIKKISDRRIELKKEFLKPYEVVETQAKELESIIKSIGDGIDQQVKAKEEDERNSKLNLINKIWLELNDTGYEIELGKVATPKWLNKTYKMTDIQTEMMMFVNKVKNDMKVIASLVNDEDKVVDLQAKYLNIFDLSSVLEEYERQNIIKEKIIFSKNDSKQEEVVEEEKYLLQFEVIGTSKQLSLLKDFLVKNNIEYRRIGE